jgi:type II secretory pathway pseudopilin PulG
LSVVGLTIFTNAQKKGRDSKKIQNLRALQVGVELFYQKNERYPTVAEFPTLGDSGQYVNQFPTPAADYTYELNGTTGYNLCIAVELSDDKNVSSGTPTPCSGGTYYYRITYP